MTNSPLPKASKSSLGSCWRKASIAIFQTPARKGALELRAGEKRCPGLPLPTARPAKGGWVVWEADVKPQQERQQQTPLLLVAASGGGSGRVVGFTSGEQTSLAEEARERLL